MNKQENSNGWGGPRNGAGRKPKADEIALIEKLKPLDELAFQALQDGLQKKDQVCLKLFMAYRFGQPKQTVEATIDGGVLLNGMRPEENALMLNGHENGHENS